MTALSLVSWFTSSTIWFARALPEDGRIVTHELKEKHAAVSVRFRLEMILFSHANVRAMLQVARANFEYAGVSSKIDIQVGPAAENLVKLEPSFDLAFIDADKPSNVIYYQQARRLVRKGGVIVRDSRRCRTS